MLIFIVAFVFSGLPIDKQIELSRFYILDNYYTAIAEQVITELQSKENTMNGEYELKFPQQFITMNNERILYIKQDLDIIISFRVTKSFFARYDFVYFSSPEARQLIEGNNKYDSFEWLDSPYWGYVKWY